MKSLTTYFINIDAKHTNSLEPHFINIVTSTPINWELI